MQEEVVEGSGGDNASVMDIKVGEMLSVDFSHISLLIYNSLTPIKGNYLKLPIFIKLISFYIKLSK